MGACRKIKTPLAKNLIYYRKLFGMTQQSLADTIGIGRSAYGYYEIDTAPPLDVLCRLARIYGISVGELIGCDTDYRSGSESRDEKGAPPQSDVLEVNSDERMLLYRYRMLNKSQKDRIQKIVSSIIGKLEP